MEAGEVKEVPAPQANDGPVDVPDVSSGIPAAVPEEEVAPQPAIQPDPDTRTSTQHHPDPDLGESVPNAALDAPARGAA